MTDSPELAELHALGIDLGNPTAVLRYILTLTDAARTNEDTFTARSHPMTSNRIFGGQVLAQAVLAASRTVAEDRPIHSMHGYFLRPGDTREALTLAVDRIHDGRSFSTRRTQVYQNAAPILSMIASYQQPSGGVEHAAPMPEGLPSPDELKPLEDSLVGPFQRLRPLLAARPIDVRHIGGHLFGPPVEEESEASEPHAAWMRTRGPIEDDPVVHAAVLAYMSDLTVQDAVMRAHRLSWGMPTVKVASLDAAMWWHRPARADEWLLYVSSSPSAQGGRGLSLGRIYAADGTLVASTTQEIMVRVKTDAGAEASSR